MLESFKLSSSCIPMSESLISMAKSFIKIENKVGDIQSPCLTPWGQGKYSVSNSLFRTTLNIGFGNIADIAA